MGADSAANTPNQRHSCLSLDKCSPDPNFSSATTAMLFNLLPASLQYLFASFILSDAPTRPSPTLSFTLRHEFGLINGTRTVFTNLDSTSHLTDSEFSIQTMNTKTYRPHSQEAFSYARFSGLHAQQELPWDGLDILGPNVEERETLYLLAKMANNAYALPGDKEWYDIGEEWNSVRGSSSGPYLVSSSSVLRRVTRLVGNRMRMVYVATCSPRKITPPW